MKAFFGWVLVVVAAPALVACGADSETASGTGGAGGKGGSPAGSTGSGGTSGASGSSPGGTGGRGGASGPASGGKNGSGGQASGGGGAACPPECFVANECVTACGQPSTNYGCCPCPAGMIDARSCGLSGNDAGGSGVSCDARNVLCKRLPPTCADGMVPAIEGSCYGSCVKIDACACSAADECPNSNEYTCHLSQRRCGPYLG